MTTLMTPTKEQIRSYYAHALERCLESFSRLEDKEWKKKASDEWTAKEHIASLVGTMENETIPLTRQAIAGEQPSLPGFEKRSDMVPFRQKNMESVRDLEPRELLQRMRTACEEHIALLDSLSEEDLDRPANSPAWDRPGTVRDLFFGSYLFLPGQYQEIRRVAKKKLPHWAETCTPDQVNYHMGRIFHYMPLIFRSDRGADVQANYQFTMEGDGGGQWAIEIGDGKAQAQTGHLENPDIEIKTKPELWMDLTSGDLNPVWAITTRKVQLGGNAGLAMKLNELFSAEE